MVIRTIHIRSDNNEESDNKEIYAAPCASCDDRAPLMLLSITQDGGNAHSVLNDKLHALSPRPQPRIVPTRSTTIVNIYIYIYAYIVVHYLSITGILSLLKPRYLLL